MKKNNIFVAAPISGFPDPKEYSEYRDSVLRFIQRLRKCSCNVYSEVERVTGGDDYDSPGSSVENDFDRIDNSGIFVLLHPKRVQTSALIELGYAFAKKKRIIIIGSRRDLPYMALGLPEVSSSVEIVESKYLCDQIVEDIADIIKKWCM